MEELTKSECKVIGDSLINYAKFLEEFIIIPDCSEDELNRMIKEIKKAGKRIKKGEYDKYIDVERLRELEVQIDEM